MGAVRHGLEEYVECIYKIQEEGRHRARTNDIARRLGVKQGSVTPMLTKLHEKGLVIYEEYRGVVLTKKGVRLGRALTRKHRILECFLHGQLGMSKDRVHLEARRLGHALSDDVERRLVKVLGKPRICPDDGKPIPYAEMNQAVGDDGA